MFFGKRRTALKILFFDGTGLCIFHKRLDVRAFRIPQSTGADGVVVIEQRELDDLLEGIDVERGRRKSAGGRKPRMH